jgi:hypothetical protein
MQTRIKKLVTTLVIATLLTLSGGVLAGNVAADGSGSGGTEYCTGSWC